MRGRFEPKPEGVVPAFDVLLYTTPAMQEIEEPSVELPYGLRGLDLGEIKGLDEFDPHKGSKR